MASPTADPAPPTTLQSFLNESNIRQPQFLRLFLAGATPEASYPKLKKLSWTLPLQPVGHLQSTIRAWENFLNLFGLAGPGLETLRLEYGKKPERNVNTVTTVIVSLLPSPVASERWDSRSNLSVDWLDVLRENVSVLPARFGPYNVGMEVSADLIGPILAKTWATLTKLCLTELVWESPGPFDLAIFGRCRTLQVLNLQANAYSRLVEVKRVHQLGEIGREQPDFVNFHHLPGTLKSLIFRHGEILANDILAAFSKGNEQTQGFKNLEALTLSGLHIYKAAGRLESDNEAFSLTSKVLKKILKSRSLVDLNLCSKVGFGGRGWGRCFRQWKLFFILRKYVGFRREKRDSDIALIASRKGPNKPWELAPGVPLEWLSTPAIRD